MAGGTDADPYGYGHILHFSSIKKNMPQSANFLEIKVVVQPDQNNSLLLVLAIIKQIL